MEGRSGPGNEAIRDDRMAPPAETGVLTRGGDTQRGEAMGERRQRGVCRPWGTCSPRTGRRQGPDSLSQPAGGTSPPDTSLPDSGLPNHGRLHSCYSQPPTLWAKQPWDGKAASPRPDAPQRRQGRGVPASPGPCEPCFSLQSAHSELPKRRSPRPCWMRRGVLGPAALPGCRRGHVPWVTPGPVRFPTCPSPPVPQRTDTAQVLDPSHKPSVSSGDPPAGPRRPGPRAAAEPQGGGRAC